MAKYGYLITGTDTGVGKTFVTLAIMELLEERGSAVAGMKPVASGCDETKYGLRNSDAIKIQQCANVDLPYEWVNPYAFKQPIAPWSAAIESNRSISIKNIRKAFEEVSARTDITLVEAVGGWRVFLTNGLQVCDLARELELSVILVVGLRLGCINHALLSAEAIEKDGVKLAGWVANHVDPEYQDIVNTVSFIRGKIKAPLLGEIPYLADENIARAASSLKASSLFLTTAY